MLDRNSEGRKGGRKDGLNEEEGDEYGGGHGGGDDKDVNTVWVVEDNIKSISEVK